MTRVAGTEPAVVTDTSPLIALARTGRDALLPRLFDRVVAPRAVAAEFGALPVYIEILDAPPDRTAELQVDLDPDEAEAVVLAEQLGALAGGLAEAFGPRVAAAGGTLSVAAGLGTVLADERRLGEVVENLLANAVTYGLGGGGTRVAVRAEPGRGGSLRLLVEDDGPGVPESYRDKVFELFQRLGRAGDGTGVGLALVARIMGTTGGSARVEPAGGPAGREGARFVLEFPASAVLALPAGSRPAR